MPPVKFAPPTEVPGLAARRIAADILDGVLHKRRTLDDQLEGGGAHPGLKTLSDRDRALMRRLVATILRRLGTLGHVLSRLLDRGIPTDAPCAPCCRAPSPCCPGSRKDNGGCRMPRQRCRYGCSATSPARPCWTCARRQAARPRNWSRPAPTSLRSTARRTVWRGCATILR